MSSIFPSGCMNDQHVTFNVFQALKCADETEPLELVSRGIEVLKPSIEELPELELKSLPDHLNNHKQALGWTLADIRGINPTIYMHKIILEEHHGKTIVGQRRFNPSMKDVGKKEIIKWLDAEIIYPISDSSWVSPVQCVPKKCGMKVVRNANNELIPSRTITGWRV
ncbi:hypothetical protein V6N12_058291 [Hibiscus sabdariffa]|uniref:Uncharacterized protein n=1 Tax=Hibiscus sabdariffa TaxID=183260 RepID=A0ABR2ETJ7_9ROSI